MNNRKSGSIFVSPAGAVVTLICFFLPWVKFSCATERTASGAELGGIFWLLFVAALTVLVAFLISINKKDLVHMKIITLICSGAALGLILFKYVQFSQGINTGMGTVRPQEIGLTIQFGGVGTLLGLIVMFIGGFFYGREGPAVAQMAIPLGPQPAAPCSRCGAVALQEDVYCGNCGQKLRE